MSTLLQNIRETAVELHRAIAQVHILNSINQTGKTFAELEEMSVKVAEAVAQETVLRMRMQVLVDSYAAEQNKALIESLKEHKGHLNG